MKNSPQKKVLLSILAGATLLTAANAHAQFTLQITEIPWSTTDPNAILMNANHWVVLKLTLVADGVHDSGILSWDFKNPVLGFTDTPGHPIGISGPLHQDWTIKSLSKPTPVPTPLSPTADPLPIADTYIVDSFFVKLPDSYHSFYEDQPTENNNLANTPANPPHNASPLLDNPPITLSTFTVPGHDYGVGSSLTNSGTMHPAWPGTELSYTPEEWANSIHAAPASMDFAYVVVPANPADGIAWIRGVVLSPETAGGNPMTVIDQQILPSSGSAGAAQTIPEPSSLFAAAFGALSLMARRRPTRR